MSETDDPRVILNGLDAVLPPVLVRIMTVHAIPPQHTSSFDAARTWFNDIAATMNTALGLVVARHYPILCGELKFDQKVDGVSRVVVDDIDAAPTSPRMPILKVSVCDIWAPINEAEIVNGQLLTWPIEEMESQFSDASGGDDGTPSPLFGANATLCFRKQTPGDDNGDSKTSVPVVVMCAHLHHVIGDAASLVKMLNDWSEITRNLGAKQTSEDPAQLCQPPLHARHLMYVAPTDIPPPPPRWCRNLVPMPLISTDAAKEYMCSVSVDEVRVRFFADKITALQTQYAREVGLPLTKNDIIVANLARCRARAEAQLLTRSAAADTSSVADDCKSAGTTERTVLDDIAPATVSDNSIKPTTAAVMSLTLLAVNIRGRITSPNPLPDHYWGNAVLGAVASVEAHAFVHGMSMAQAAAAIHQQVRAFAAPESLRAVLDWEASRSDRTRVLPLVDAGHTALSAWQHFPMYGIDFGFGAPALATSLIRPGPVDGLGFMQPSPPAAVSRDGALLDIAFGMKAEPLAMMLADPEFIGVAVGVMQHVVRED